MSKGNRGQAMSTTTHTRVNNNCIFKLSALATTAVLTAASIGVAHARDAGHDAHFVSPSPSAKGEPGEGPSSRIVLRQPAVSGHGVGKLHPGTLSHAPSTMDPAAVTQGGTHAAPVDGGSADHSSAHHGPGMHAPMRHEHMNSMPQGTPPSESPTTDHSSAGHNSMAPMDHGTMGHGQAAGAPMQHDPMNHSDMGHDNMDHGNMGHNTTHAAGAQTEAATTSRTPIPVLTDADRQAAFLDAPGHAVHDKAVNWFAVLDQLEWQNGDGRSSLSWEGSAWIGGDVNRLWLRSEGERTSGVTEEAELQALWGHSISPWWDVVAGVRHDFKPSTSQTWAALGVQGMALYGFEAEATAFLGENGQAAVRLEGEYDILLTNRLILQPAVEVNFHGKNDRERGIGSGLTSTEIGLRLRYELRREFAPYIGVTWNRSYGNTADYLRADGESPDDVRFVAGVRMWF